MRHVLFSPPDITEAEISEVVDALKSGWITTGPKTKKLEQLVAERCHTSKAVCLNSNTACAEITLRILGIGIGDEVIVPAYTYTATASVVEHVGARLVMIDCEHGKFTMDYEKLEAAITERTKAIIPVDLFGIPCGYDTIFDIVERKKNLFHPNDNPIQKALNRVIVMADGAHSFGASYKKFPIGSVADFTNFSFHAVKNLTTAEGGAVVWRDIEGIDNDELYHQYMLLSLHGQSKDALAKTKLGAWEYDIIGPWYKCNMTDIMAAIGLRQLDRYLALLARRKEIIAKYDRTCDALGIKHMQHHIEGMDSSNHLYLIRVPGIKAEERNKIIEKMADKGVATNVHYKPLPLMTAYGTDCSAYPNAYDYYQNLITLPLHTLLTDEDAEYVCKTLTAVIKESIE